MSNDISSEEHQIIYEQYFVDVQDPSTSSVIDDHQIDLDDSGGAHIVTPDKYDSSSVKDSSEEVCSSLTATPDSSVQVKRLKQAEAARRRYQEMSAEERKEMNARRMQAQKRKRQRDKEVCLSHKRRTLSEVLT
ncbi:hypothetical protein Tcan_02146 [Toxocara canis]|uniref:Uncharacterized protein n=1 Tax=Toxocara canis TaxID=6265 RepID=A0A0B2UR63_TOXCA|nr:hypothetical protein Tcan_02146 [Toxocara canis]